MLIIDQYYTDLEERCSTNMFKKKACIMLIIINTKIFVIGCKNITIIVCCLKHCVINLKFNIHNNILLKPNWLPFQGFQQTSLMCCGQIGLEKGVWIMLIVINITLIIFWLKHCGINLKFNFLNNILFKPN